MDTEEKQKLAREAELRKQQEERKRTISKPIDVEILVEPKKKDLVCFILTNRHDKKINE